MNWPMTVATLKAAWLYAHSFNLYGDAGNIRALVYRARLRGIELVVRTFERGESLDSFDPDIVYAGGAQDEDQARVAEDLLVKGKDLRRLLDSGAVGLFVCGAYQLIGDLYVTSSGRHLKGLGLVDAWTISGERRIIGDAIVASAHEGVGTLIGFENHAGRTYLGSAASPLGRVHYGRGNNGTDGTEGIMQGTAIGTYLHGPLLPKNPQLTDHILRLALHRHNVGLPGVALDDTVEFHARNRILRRYVKTRFMT